MITLVLGGARSGKSSVAEGIVTALVPPVTYVATLDVADDADLMARVQRHRERRPSTWRTVQVGPELPEVLRGVSGTVLVDSLGPWVGAAPDMQVDTEALCAALAERHGDTVVVSDEVGLAVHPSTEEGRLFRDAVGALNQAVAAAADDVILVVAGRIVHLDRPLDR